MPTLVVLARLLAVAALLAGVLWALRRTQGARRTHGPTTQLVTSTRLAKGASLAVVRIGDRGYALGVTEHAVTLLSETELPETVPAGVPARNAAPALRSVAGWLSARRAKAPAPQQARVKGAAPSARPSFALALQQQMALLRGRDVATVVPLNLHAAGRPRPSRHGHPSFALAAADGPAAAPHRRFGTPPRMDAAQLRSQEHPCPRLSRPPAVAARGGLF